MMRNGSMLLQVAVELGGGLFLRDILGAKLALLRPFSVTQMRWLWLLYSSQYHSAPAQDELEKGLA